MIADASSGFQRACVVLYACAPGRRDAARILVELRNYTVARDWVAIDEVVEGAPTVASIDDRPGWQRVRALIESQRAEGIVVGTDARCAHAHPDRSRLGQWLAERGTAFLVTAARPAGGDRVA